MVAAPEWRLLGWLHDWFLCAISELQLLQASGAAAASQGWLCSGMPLDYEKNLVWQQH